MPTGIHNHGARPQPYLMIHRRVKLEAVEIETAIRVASSQGQELLQTEKLSQGQAGLGH